jgi:hypothetical protein
VLELMYLWPSLQEDDVVYKIFEGRNSTPEESKNVEERKKRKGREEGTTTNTDAYLFLIRQLIVLVWRQRVWEWRVGKRIKRVSD